MADAISFRRIEEQYLVPFSHRFVARPTPHIDATVREHQLRLDGVLFGTLAAQASPTAHVTHRDCWGVQERLNAEFSHVRLIVRRRGGGVRISWGKALRWTLEASTIAKDFDSAEAQWFDVLQRMNSRRNHG